MPCVPADRDRDSPPSGRFNPRHNQYSCCFQQLHSRSGSMLIALFHIVLALGYFVFVIKNFGRRGTDATSYVEGFFQILCVFVMITANLVFLIGLRIENRHIVSFFICFQTCLICFFFIVFLSLILGFKMSLIVDPPVLKNGKATIEQELRIVFQIFISLGIVFVEVWFITVILKSFRYLNDKFHFDGMDAVVEV